MSGDDMVRQVRLILCFSRGVGLATWAETGTLERELALYRALRPHLAGITLITHGDRRDLELARGCPELDVVCNRWQWPEPWYRRWLTTIPWARFRGAGVIKSNQLSGAELALALARRWRLPFIARCGYLLSFPDERRHGPDPLARARALALEKNVFSQADRVVVTTSRLQQVVASRHEIPVERIRVIPNYVAIDQFCPGPAGGSEVDRVIYVGRLNPEKNLLALIEAMAPLSAELWLVGEGPLREALAAAALKLGGRVRFWGRTPHERLPELFRQVSLAVLPSRYEGHPKALLEAMACGLAVVGTDVEGIREVIRHDETGWLCGLGVAELREAIVGLLADRERRARLGAAARRAIEGSVALDRVVEQELILLQELQGPWPKSGC